MILYLSRVIAPEPSQVIVVAAYRKALGMLPHRAKRIASTSKRVKMEGQRKLGDDYGMADEEAAEETSCWPSRHGRDILWVHDRFSLHLKDCRLSIGSSRAVKIF